MLHCLSTKRTWKAIAHRACVTNHTAVTVPRTPVCRVCVAGAGCAPSLERAWAIVPNMIRGETEPSRRKQTGTELVVLTTTTPARLP